MFAKQSVTPQNILVQMNNSTSHNEEDVEEDIALLTENINSIQSELFARQMLKEKLEKKLSAKTKKKENGYYETQDKNNKKNQNNEREEQEKLLYQPEELNTLTKKMLAIYLENREDQLKDLFKDASGEVSGDGLATARHQNYDVYVNIRCGHGADYVLRLKLPENTTFGEVCKAAKDFFGIPKHIKVVLRDQAGNFFSDDVNMRNDFAMLPEQSLFLVHVHKPTLAELQKYQIGDMQNVHTGGLSRRKRDESRGFQIMRGLVADLPKTLIICIIMVLWTFSGDIPAESAAFHSKIKDVFFKPRFGTHHQFSFNDISDIDMMWGYLDGPLNDILFTTSHQGVQGVIEESTYILGSVRLRQQRVYENSCESRTTTSATESTSPCYGEYFGRGFGIGATEDQGKANYWGHSICNVSKTSVPGELVKTAFTEYIDDTVSALSGFVTSNRADFVIGALASYDPSGYILSVGLEDKTTFTSVIAALKTCQWIDMATRVIYIEVNFFNPTMNMYQAGHIRFEISPTGLVVPQFFFEGFRLDIISSVNDQIAYGLEWLIFVWCLYQINRWRHDLAEIKKDTGSIVSWCLNIWTVLEALTVIVFLNVFFLRNLYLQNIHREHLTNKEGIYDNEDALITKDFVFLGSMAYRYGQNTLWMVLATFLSSLKILKYMKIGRAPRVLWTTLKHAVPPMLVFIMMFLLIMSGFVLFFHSVYGTQVRSFSTVMLSTRAILTSMVNHLVGESHHFRPIMKLPWSNNFMHPVMFVVFVVICHFILLNMFIAIMNDAHKVAHFIAERTQGEFPPLTGYVICYSICGKNVARKCGGHTTMADSDDEDSEEEEDMYGEEKEKENDDDDDDRDDEEKEDDADWNRVVSGMDVAK